MKKVISFEKELGFPTMIGEITSISLDQNIEFIDSSSAVGEMIVSGGYKLTEASTLIEDFKYDIPVEITLTEKLDLSTTKISISDFNYEIINDDILKCNIDLLLEGVEEVEIEEQEELEVSEVDEETEEKKDEKVIEIEQIENLDDDSNRECDGDLEENKDEQELPVKMEDEEELPFKISSKEENEIEMPQAEINILKKEEEKMEKQEEPLTSNISSLFQVFENSEETFTTYSVYIMRKDDTIDRIMDHYHVNREQLSEYNDLDNLEIGSKIIIPSYHE